MFKGKKRFNSLWVCFIYLFFICNTSSVNAALEKNNTDIIFVVDCSNSMNDVDSEHMIYDSVHMIKSSATEGFRFGLVAFNSKVVCRISLEEDESVWTEKLENITYDGYTNAGLAIKTAINMFQNNVNEKRIIYISDGEIDMGTEDETAVCVEQFQKQIEKAESSNIQITAIKIGDRNQKEFQENYKKLLRTGGEVLEFNEVISFYEWCEDYITNQLGIPYRSAGMVKTANRNLSIKLPDTHMNCAKILLKGKNIPKYTLECQAKKITDIAGEHFVVLDMENPVDDKVTIAFGKDVTADVEAYLLCNYKFQLNADYSYNQSAQRAHIVIKVMNQYGDNLLSGILEKQGGINIFFDGQKMNYSFTPNDEIAFDVPTYETMEHRIEIGLENICGGFYELKPCNITVVVPSPEKSLWEKFLPLWVILIVLLFAVSLIWFLFHRMGKREQEKPERSPESRVIEVPVEPRKKKYEFEGKINLYVLKTKEGEDIPPQSLNLYSRYTKDMITLQWILDTCGIAIKLEDAEKIVFKPGNKRALLVRNTGEATLLKGRELLLKSQQYPLHFDEKVTILFENEETELEIHYKNLKPKER